MNPIDIIQKYYPADTFAYTLLVEHSKNVAAFALELAEKHPELNADTKFIYEAAMLHDIGIYLTNATDLGCFGSKPYICHGYLGREILEKEGLEKHALVCERHTGAGLTILDITNQGLPIPIRDMLPITIAEQIICYADKFYSKSGDTSKRKDIEKIRKSMLKHGIETLKRFDLMHENFGL